MTNLYIAGVAVSLPPNFKANIAQENPFATKRGEYSYDIELSLLDPVNARLYKHKNRLNYNTSDIVDRVAELVVNDRVLLKGTEIILGYTNTSVKIQIASGNSALNYSFSSQKKIWENDFGTEPIASAESAWAKLEQTYPTTNCQYVPYIVRAESDGYTYNITPFIVNMWNAVEEYGTAVRGDLAPCPYLMYYIEKFVELKGFTLNSNVLLTDARAMKSLILNPQKTRVYADILPDWTEKEFVDEIQKLFNVHFIVNTLKNTIDIVREASSVVTSETITLEKVIKTHEEDINKTSSSEVYKNVKYNFPSNTYFDYQHFSDGVLENLVITDFPNYAALSVGVPRTYDTYAGLVGTRHIFKTTDNNELYMLNGFQYGVDFSDSEDDKFYYNLRKLNIFKDYIINSTASVMNLKITPARMLLQRWYHSRVPVSQLNFAYQYPWCSEMPVAAEYKNLLQTIEEGINAWRPSLMELCMFTGKKQFTIESTEGISVDILVPYTHTDFDSELKDVSFGFPTRQAWDALIATWYTATDTYRLNGSGGMAASYYSQLLYDETKPTTIYFLQQNNFDVKSEIIINNKKYVCEKIEYDVDKDGIVGNMIKGTFYPVLE